MGMAMMVVAYVIAAVSATGAIICFGSAVRDSNIRFPRLPDSRWADRVGWFGVIFLAVAFAPTWPLVTLGLLLAVVGLRAWRREAHRRAERLRLIADCDAQHRAIMDNDLGLGFFGRYPCAAAFADGRLVTDSTAPCFPAPDIAAPTTPPAEPACARS
jgi:hypothetical protein